MSLWGLDKDTYEISETSMVDLAYKVLSMVKEPWVFTEIYNEVARIKQFSDEERDRYIAQCYTEFSLDARFAFIGQAKWGLNEWYTREFIDNLHSDGTNHSSWDEEEEDFDDFDDYDEFYDLDDENGDEEGENKEEEMEPDVDEELEEGIIDEIEEEFENDFEKDIEENFEDDFRDSVDMEKLDE